MTILRTISLINVFLHLTICYLCEIHIKYSFENMTRWDEDLSWGDGGSEVCDKKMEWSWTHGLADPRWKNEKMTNYENSIGIGGMWNEQWNQCEPTTPR
jgi:hypothetical protein